MAIPAPTITWASYSNWTEASVVSRRLGGFLRADNNR